MSILSVYAVFADAEEAEWIGRTVVEEKLAACINVLGACRSIYRWKGKIETAEEVPAILKTHGWQVDQLIARIAELHSYETPCVVAFPIEKLLRSYADWVEISVVGER
jgi:periplasmic divalent cation tolerance protein